MDLADVVDEDDMVDEAAANEDTAATFGEQG
jgi:hypothetical protein